MRRNPGASPADMLLKRMGDYGRACRRAERLGIVSYLVPTLGGEVAEMQRHAQDEVTRIGDDVAAMVHELARGR